jgi:acetoin utilization protein AcuB
MKAADIMRSGRVVSRDISIRDAEKVFAAQGVKILPVISRGRLAGIITHGDLARALPSNATTLSKTEMHYWLDEIPIEELVKEPVSVTPDMELLEVAALAAQKGFYNFPVAEDHKFLGMIYEEDLFRFLAGEAQRPALKIEVRINESGRGRTPFLKRLGFGGAP